jgi:uncharacterized protein YkwD
LWDIHKVVPNRMKSHSPVHLLAMFCAGAMVAACAKKPEASEVAVPAARFSDSPLASRVFQEVNTYRRSQGARDLQRHAGLDRLARQHCEYLRQHRGTSALSGKNVSHFGFEGRVMAARQLYHMTSVSENVAASSQPGANPAPAVVRLWAGSKDHRKNMLDDWTDTGIGVVVDSDGTVFATEIFATVSYSRMTPRVRINQF